MLKYLVVATVLASGGTVLADPKFEYGKAEEVAKVKGVEWNASAEAGITFTTGNSETTSGSAGFKAARKKAANKLAIEGSATYARAGVRVLADKNGNGLIDNSGEIVTEKQVSAESLAGKIRYDRFLTELNSLFVAGVISRDLPAGKELVLGAQLGYSRNIYKTKTANALAELGADYDNEKLTTGPSLNIISARAFVGYKAEMTPGTTFESSGELLTNLNKETLPTGADGGVGQDTRFNFKAAIVAKIGKDLAFQSSLEAKYDHRPGPLPIKNLAMGFVPEASNIDTIMKVSLLYTFF